MKMDLDVRQLRAFETLFDERNLSRAAQLLDVTQPAMSKTLAQMRHYFADPLFVRVGREMQPTARAVELEAEIRSILSKLTALKARQVPFDPRVSARTFTFCVVDAGLVRLLPPLIALLDREAPNVQLRVVPLDLQRLEGALESGKLDFAMGSFPSLSKKIRRQHLWSLRYVSAVRREHPRLRGRVTRTRFLAERHISVTTAGTGHAHQRAERAVQRAISAERIVCTVPTFVTAALIASETDAVVTLPEPMLAALADKLELRLFEPPIALPQIDVSQHWHERFHRDPGSVWIRDVFARLFATS